MNTVNNRKEKDSSITRGQVICFLLMMGVGVWLARSGSASAEGGLKNPGVISMIIAYLYVAWSILVENILPFVLRVLPFAIGAMVFFWAIEVLTVLKDVRYQLNKMKREMKKNKNE